jgi:nitrogen fixation protein NifQ
MGAGAHRYGSGEFATDASAIYEEIFRRGEGCGNRDSFTAHVFACLLTVSIVESRALGRSVAESIGLGREALATLIALWAPAGRRYIEERVEPERVSFDEEEEQLHSLFARYCGDECAETRWIAAILARRSMSPNHLWQDLGLASRDELGRLMRERFPELALRNIHNMKWKKFFYRSLCELEGFTLCTAPTCAECSDFDNCFGEENGEGLLARARNDSCALGATQEALAPQGE